MRHIVIVAFSLLLGFAAAPVSAERAVLAGFQNPTIQHGGGCRKSSPAGQCCHADRKRGGVHCH